MSLARTSPRKTSLLPVPVRSQTLLDAFGVNVPTLLSSNPFGRSSHCPVFVLQTCVRLSHSVSHLTNGSHLPSTHRFPSVQGSVLTHSLFWQMAGVAPMHVRCSSLQTSSGGLGSLISTHSPWSHFCVSVQAVPACHAPSTQVFGTLPSHVFALPEHDDFDTQPDSFVHIWSSSHF